MNFKLALVAVAAVGVASTAQAADLAKKAPAAANYVKVCDAFGAGFFYIPGSDTCLKISGFVYAEARGGTGKLGRYDTTNSAFGNRTRSGNDLYSRTRAEIQFDARTATEMGLLRSYIALRHQTNTGDTSGTLMAAGAFVQFAGVTAGYARSNFDFAPAGYSYGTDYSTNAYSYTFLNQLAYTFSFGNGVSATLALEDPSSTDLNFSGASHRFVGNSGSSVAWVKYDSTKTNPFTGAAYAAPYAGVRAPDVVANLAVAQAWGKAQLSVAYHDVYSTVDDTAAWAISGGVEVNLPMLAAGDKAYLVGTYSSGAVAFATQLQNATGKIQEVFFNAFGSGIGQDFVIVNGKNKLTNTWAVNGGLHHEFSPQWELNVDAGYVKVDGYQWRDEEFVGAGVDLRWKPVKGFQIGADVEYGKLTFSNNTVNAIKGVAAASTLKSSYDGWLGEIRVRRDF
ncbi:porin [Siculibacillus lacustris]|uniref:Porin n=1 Tax=Siculibacillus lacustris TaxID=1549641 RepID=A0A4Q9VVI4_9HYPH|nr:porin [Siculibacillus lacustris]TBW39760.1 porin [Siculibacillus lacustris]